MQTLIKGFAILAFGLLLPVALLYVFYTNLDGVSKKLSSFDSATELQQDYGALNKNLVSANDFILFSLMYVEQSNQKTMMNKQAMKLTIIYIGFAIMSVGMMFMILGINDGGGEGTGKWAGAEFNFKAASTGLIIFVAGALMASGGALINNRYSTAAVPGYIQVLNQTTPATQDKSTDMVGLYKSCRKYEDTKFKDCLVAMVQSLYEEELK